MHHNDPPSQRTYKNLSYRSPSIYSRQRRGQVKYFLITDKTQMAFPVGSHRKRLRTQRPQSHQRSRLRAWSLRAHRNRLRTQLSRQNRQSTGGQGPQRDQLQRQKPKQTRRGNKSHHSQRSRSVSNLRTDYYRKAQSLLTRRKANEGKQLDIAVVDLFAGLRTVHVAAERTRAKLVLAHATEKCPFATRLQ